MSNYQQMIEVLTNSYVATLDKSQDEQEWLENEILTRLKSKSSRGIKFSSLRIAFVDVIRPAFNEETPCLMENRDPIKAYAESAAIEEYLSTIQYDLMRHCVILERALALSAVANPTYERSSTGEWV
ncbi:hypothetical protein Pcaca05_05560 [Pectobacterium carotovorum subsp. carotovorum]|nr:hypothetical protein Pcaca05_05560 [Pectobacterium carotovorum subsp. carotovorum]